MTRVLWKYLRNTIPAKAEPVFTPTIETWVPTKCFTADTFIGIRYEEILLIMFGYHFGTRREPWFLSSVSKWRLNCRSFKNTLRSSG